MKRIFNSFLLLLSISMVAPSHAITLPSIPWQTLKLKGKIIADNVASAFSYPNQVQAIRLYRNLELAQNLLPFANQLVLNVLKGKLNAGEVNRNNLPIYPSTEEYEAAFKKLDMNPKYLKYFEGRTPNINKSHNLYFFTMHLDRLKGERLQEERLMKNPQVRLMLMGHDLVKFRDHHYLKQMGISIALPFIASAIQNMSGTCLDAVFKKAEQSQYLQKYPKVLGLLQSLKDVTKVTIASPFFKFFFVKSIKAMVSRSLEKSVDLAAAQELGCTQGGIAFFNSCIEQEKNESWFSWEIPPLNLEYILPKLQRAIGLSNIPSAEERVKYLTELATASK